MLKPGDKVRHKGDLFTDIRTVISVSPSRNGDDTAVRLSPDGLVLGSRLDKVDSTRPAPEGSEK